MCLLGIFFYSVITLQIITHAPTRIKYFFLIRAYFSHLLCFIAAVVPLSPFVGMAGRHTASPIPHASPGGEGVLSDMAGSPRPTAGSSRSSRAAPPPGTAGTVSAAGHEAHSVTSGASPSGTAGTRRPGGTGRTPAKAQTPPAATAGTAPQRADAPPGVNHGTRRMKGAMPPTPGGTGKSPKTRKKRSEP